MILALVMAGLAIAGILALVLYLIVVDILQPEALFAGMGTVIALLLVLPLSVPPLVSSLLLLKRQRWTRFLHTATAAAITLIWLYFSVSLGPDRNLPLILTPSILLLVASVVFVWLPSSKTYFLRATE